MQKEHQPNAIHCKMMEHKKWAKYFATCNTIECFSELIKITQFYFSVIVHDANVERFFPWCSHKHKREIFVVQPVSTLLKLVCNLNIFHTSSFIILLKALQHFLRKLQNIHELNRQMNKYFVLCILTEISSKTGRLTSMLKLINRPICYFNC